LFAYEISGTAERICAKFTRTTCLVSHSDEFECQRSRLPGTETAFSASSVACVRFMFGRTSLASSVFSFSFFYPVLGLVVTSMNSTLTAWLVLRWVAFRGLPPWYVTSHSGQLSLLPSAGRRMSISQGAAAVLCGREGNRRSSEV